jgi:GTPase-associated system helical domain
MIEGLPELYGRAAIAQVTEDALEKRSKAILTITTKRKMPWLLDCVRLYLKKPITGDIFRGEFVKTFKDEDSMFYEADNDLELRVLAGAVINEYISKNKNEDRYVLAMALLSGCFGMADRDVINAQNISKAAEIVEATSNDLRTGDSGEPPTIPELGDIPGELADFPSVRKFLAKLNDTFGEFVGEYEASDKALRHKVNVLSEESQIHWWLFRSFSNSVQQRFEELDAKVAPVVLAYELYLVTEMIPGPVNADEFLKKAFSMVPGINTNKYSIKEAVTALYEHLSENIKALDFERFGNLCPLVLGVHRSLDSAGDAGWTKVFERSTGLSADFSDTPLEIAMQFYNEALLCYSNY